MTTEDQLIYDLAEDLAEEILGQFSDEDYIHLTHSLDKLQRACQHLESRHLAAPPAVKIVLAKFNVAFRRNLGANGDPVG